MARLNAFQPPEIDGYTIVWNIPPHEDQYTYVENQYMVKEQDPHGKQQGEPGAKMDAGKVSVVRGCLHYFPRAIREVARLSTIGAKKYSWKGWEAVPDGINRYGDAMGRHELQIGMGGPSAIDPDTGVLEATAVAWNAFARLELILREQENG